MRIKRLEIIGFKSFCDRTVVRFEDPITGVVGPNGCGKSNVVDAIRWCMGEQSAKHLRGKAMQDVIFSGSDKRGPLGFCEVSLTFENDGRIPVEYLQFTEVTVSRRLFRDGTSEYYINKTPCRLRDITELFMGTGIGTRAYSIIEQGRVSQIISAKPEERRFLIEEAAGITKYKLRKKAAEQKLEQTRQNLLRLSDVVAEQERQLASLKRQADKAERYKRYRAELRDIELWGMSQRWLGLTLEARVYFDLVAASAEALAQVEAARQTIEAELAAGRLTLVEEETRLQQVQEELYVLDNRVKLSEAENEHARREETRLLEQARKLNSEKEALYERAQQATLELQKLTEERESLSREDLGRDDRSLELEAALKSSKEQLGGLQKAADHLKAEVTRQHAEIARSEAGERSLTRQVEDLEVRLGRSEEEAKRLRDRKAELDDEIYGQEAALGGLKQARIDLLKSRETAEERVKDLKLLTSRLDKEVDHLKGELHKKKGRLHSLGELAARNEGFSLGSRMLLKRAEGKADKPKTVADLIVAPAELELALDAVLGERLGALVTPSHAEAVESIGYLQQQGEGKAFLVPEDARPTRPGERPARPDDEARSHGIRGRLLDLIEKKPGFDAVLDALLGSVLVVDTLEHAVAYYRTASEDGSLPPAASLVTLDGVVIDGHGTVVGGAQKGQGASVLAVRRELRELTQQVAELDERFKTQEEQLVVGRKELTHLQESLAELQKAGHQGEMQLLSLDKDLLKAREEMHRVSHRLESIDRERNELSTRRDEMVRESEELRLSLRTARDLLEQLEEQLERQSRSQVGLFDAVDKLGQELTQLKVSQAAHREKVVATERAIARLQQEEVERAARIDKLGVEERDSYKKAAQLASEVHSRGSTITEHADRRSILGEELQVLRNAYEQKRGALSTREMELRERRDRENRQGKEALAHKARLSELTVQQRALEESIIERHRVRVEDIVIDYHLRPQVSRAEEERAAELRELIDRMGEINLTAIDEWNELSKRYNFLVSQKTDLETALGQLEQAIVLINKTSRQRFQQVYDLVNTKFQELFPRCFVGGHAHLKLVGSDDILEAGIEIFAQPPGKKNQTVELLSGGEKAMTAVALIFAIFLIKPSPFCLLDEVDAPLDEANVGRFNELVRSMTDRSQFILITHNKRTMQIADTLYGVTMEEPGVSKVVSVNLHEVGRLQARRRAA
ncbi:MAG: chromosome segregation protein SMC [Myxococcales bacterium]|nr:chromosome segregation protein SMC [Myxococcales bacterium]